MVSEARKQQIRAAMRTYRKRHPELCLAYKRTEGARRTVRALNATKRQAELDRRASLPDWLKRAMVLLVKLRATKVRDDSRQTQKTTRPNYMADWRAANLPKVAAYARNYRGHRAKTADGTFTPESWALRIEEFGNRCGYCHRVVSNLTVDHITALSVGGEHSIHNCIPACKSCNSRKNSKGILTMVNVTVSPS